MAFREITPEEIRDNMFVTINKEWMLLTAGNGKSPQHHDGQLGQHR